MARLWTSGFELQSVTAGVEYLSNTGTAPTISTTTFRSGAAAIRFNPTAATSLIQITYAVGAIRRHFVRFAVRFASFPTADVPIMQFWDGASAFPSLWLINSTKTLRVRDGNPADVSGDSAALSLNTWYVIQFDYDDTISTPPNEGPVNAYLDGVQFATNVSGWNIGGVGDIRIGICATASADMFVDDVAINDVTGSVETGLPDKDGKVVLLLPDSAGDNNLWPTAVGGVAGAANNFTRADEIPPDDVTSYNQLATTGTTQIDDFNVASAASAGIGGGDTIKLVGVGIRTGSTAVTAASIVSRLKGQSGGTTTESSSINVNVNGWRTGGVVAGGSPQPWANIIAYTNPQTSTAWTTTSLDSMQIGYRANVSQSTTRRVTGVWATVEYVPSVNFPRVLPARRRGVRITRGKAATAPPPQAVAASVPYPPKPVRSRLRLVRALRGRAATPVPAQIAPTPPTYPPQPERSRIRGVRLFRGRASAPPADRQFPSGQQRSRRWLPRPARSRTAGPVPPQIVTPPPYVPLSVRARVRGMRIFRDRIAGPVPPQIVVPAASYPPAPVRVRLRGLRLFRSRSVAPVPGQVTPVPPSYVPPAVRSRIKALFRRSGRATAPVASQPLAVPSTRPRPRMAPPRRGHPVGPVPPQASAPPPAYPPRPTRPRLKGLRLPRGRTAKPAPAQVVLIPPAFVPALTRFKRRILGIIRGQVVTPVAPGADVCDCTTHRPSSGTTARPSAGITARPGAGMTSRPGTGMTARPDGGTTERPCSCND